MDRLYYTLKIKYNDEISYTYSNYIEAEAFEDWGDSPKNHKPLKDITYDQVVALNGKHIIYGIVETFEQDKTKYLEWYDRRVVTYSWEWTEI